MRFFTFFAAVAAASIVAGAAEAGPRVNNSTTVVVGLDGYGGDAPYYNTSNFPLARPYTGRVVNQEYCGADPVPCHQYANTYQPYAPPRFIRLR